MTSLRLHIRLKCGNKKFKCEVCGQLFKNHSVMVVHTRCHFGERPHKCVHCGVPHRTVSALKTHYITQQCISASAVTNKGVKNSDGNNTKWKNFQQTRYSRLLFIYCCNK